MTQAFKSQCSMASIFPDGGDFDGSWESSDGMPLRLLISAFQRSSKVLDVVLNDVVVKDFMDIKSKAVRYNNISGTYSQKVHPDKSKTHSIRFRSKESSLVKLTYQLSLVTLTYQLSLVTLTYQLSLVTLTYQLSSLSCWL